MTKRFFLLPFLALSLFSNAQFDHQSKFEQLGPALPTPNQFRTASGMPGPQYYQQKADYDIDITLDDRTQSIRGSEIITYTNNSPDLLPYLWVQLDQNMRHPESMAQKMKKGTLNQSMSPGYLLRFHYDFEGGFNIEEVSTTSGKPLPHVINNTMMRIDLEKPLASGQKFSFRIKWHYNINDRMKYGGRSGMEYFEEDSNHLYTIAQFHPRMAVYNDVEGWQNKQFLGQGEFTLPFGDFKVKITVPADHVVEATGTLKNASSVLTSEQRKRMAQAEKSFDKPVMIITEEEARENEKNRNYDKTKTWVFEAKNVRDFAFVSSRKFIWDAMAVKLPSRTVMAISLYPKEGNPLWEKYSTRVVAHTLEVYSKHTFDYPYEKAVSVHSNRIGMEYPMICFNGGRPQPDGSYSAATKHGMISVIIHEVGHNYFPMIVNSDERQWTWMDEGLNSFLQFLTEQEWDREYPSRRGPPHKIVDYMKGDKNGMVPIMTHSESILQFGNNAYGKPATALNILRETVMGRELFDYAFKHYSQTWMFKHPTPADFFRAMEDASGVDLDWFWRGWFYTTDHVDIALTGVKPYTVAGPAEAHSNDPHKQSISYKRNREAIEKTVVERDSTMRDKYNAQPTPDDAAHQQTEWQAGMDALPENQRNLLRQYPYYYELSFENVGGLVMPVVLEFTFSDGAKHVERLPAKIR